MTVQERIRARVVPHLPPGETYVIAVPVLSGLLPGILQRYRILVVTDTRIHLFSARLFRIGDPKRLIETFPPGTAIEPGASYTRSALRVAFLQYNEIHVGHRRLWALFSYRHETQRAIEITQARGVPLADP